MLRNQIQDLFRRAVEDAKSAGILPDVTIAEPEIQRPNQPDHGDYSSNIAMVTAAAVKKERGEKANPRQIAQAIVDHFPLTGPVGAVEIAGPGFINVRLSDTFLQSQISSITAAGADFGAIDRGRGESWQVEFVSANPTGPLHFGGARNAVLGDSLANVLAAAGYAVQREFYVNDAGTQFQLFAESLYAHYMRQHGRPIDPPKNGYAGAYMGDYAHSVTESLGDSLVGLAPAAALDVLKERGLALVLADLRRDLDLIGVGFDRWFSEKSLYDDGLVADALAQLERQGEIVEKDGARWFLASRYPKNDKDEVVIRSNGIPTYFASDIAYHYDKFVRRHFDRVVNVWAVDHQGHVPRMAAVMQALGLDPERLVIMLYNLVKLTRDGQEVKMSKRAGEFLTLGEVVEEVGPDAVRFMLLTRSPESSIEFDLALAVAQSNENPVYYVQYSHARICSILDKAAAEGLPAPEAEHASSEALALLSHPAELSLLRKMLQLEEEIDFAVDKLSPHNLTHYAMELAAVFNSFYRDCRVVDPENLGLSRARLLLCMAARTALARVLSLMGMNAPESM